MKEIYIIHLDWNVKGDTEHEIKGVAFESYRDACYHLATYIKEDFQYIDWLEYCNIFYMRDMEGKEIDNNTPIPDFIESFSAQDTEDSPEYYEEYYIQVVTLIPKSTDSQIEEQNL